MESFLVNSANARFLTFAPISHVSAQKSSSIGAIYYFPRRSGVFGILQGKLFSKALGAKRFAFHYAEKGNLGR